MSDERFDADLRSVLLEDVPPDVPDDLRRRVAAIPATHPAPGRRSRFGPRRSALGWAAGLALVALVVGVGVWRFAPVVGPGSGPTTSAAASPEPSSPVASPSGAGSACTAADLTGRILDWQGAAGSRIAAVEIANTSARSCTVAGTPGLELVDAGGRRLMVAAADPGTKPSDRAFPLDPGGRLRTEVQVSNYCGPTPALPLGIAFTLPSDGGRFVAQPAAGVSSELGVPPCNGPTGAAIEMNGWRP